MKSLFLASILAGELCRPAPHTSLELPGDTTCWRGGCIDVMSPAQGKTTAGACTEEAIPDEVLRGLFAATDTVPKGKVATSAEVAAAATALGLPSQQKDVIKVQRGPAKGSLPPLSVALPGVTGAALLSADPLPFVTIVHFDGDKHADVVVGALSMKSSGSIVARATVLLGPFEPRLGQPKRQLLQGELPITCTTPGEAGLDLGWTLRENVLQDGAGAAIALPEVQVKVRDVRYSAEAATWPGAARSAFLAANACKGK